MALAVAQMVEHSLDSVIPVMSEDESLSTHCRLV